MALRREVDLGLVRELQHPDIERHALYDDVLVLVAAGSHRFGDRAVVGPQELAGARLILFDRTSSYYELTNAFFREAGVAPSGVIELDNIDAAKQMVGQGLGIALLPHTSVAAELADGRLRTIDIEGAAPIRRRIVAIRRRDIGPPDGPVAAFLGILGKVHEVLPALPGAAGGQAVDRAAARPRVATTSTASPCLATGSSCSAMDRSTGRRPIRTNHPIRPNRCCPCLGTAGHRVPGVCRVTSPWTRQRMGRWWPLAPRWRMAPGSPPRRSRHRR